MQQYYYNYTAHGRHLATSHRFPSNMILTRADQTTNNNAVLWDITHLWLTFNSKTIGVKRST
jgi:hypothetical protein